MLLRSLLAVTAVAAPVLAAVVETTAKPVVFSTTCNGKSYTYNELAGYGFVASDARDKFGDSISLGSSISIISWCKSGGKYTGKLYGLPDRGWNGRGTINFQPRVHVFTLTFTPVKATLANPSAPNLVLTYKDTILLTGPDGQPMTGLDADQDGGLQYPNFPLLPAATFTGDGFGEDSLDGDGPSKKLVTLDPESMVLAGDGGFWISDEYGPYVYKFDKTGKMTLAIAPPDALLPLRNGQVSFPSNNPPADDPTKVPVPGNPTQGRQNNQGFEGMSISPDGKTLWVLLQTAARQEGGSSASTRIPARLLKYDITNSASSRPTVTYKAEYVVPMPTFKDANGNTLIAAQSEMHFVSNTQFFFLPRDTGNGHGLSSNPSLYRHVDIFDISAATNVKGPEHDAFNATIASTAGVVNPGITPATVCPFLNFNINDQLGRFKLHNGGTQDAGMLNEKWEGLALVPVGNGDASEYFLFASSDNDFITQNGAMNFGKITFADPSGFNLDNQMLVFKVTLPKYSAPLEA